MHPRPLSRYCLAMLAMTGALAAQSPITDINALPPTIPSSSPTNYVTIGGTTYFSANDGVNGVELWKTDGTTAGTVMVRDINPGSASSSPTNLTEFGGLVYFSANNGVVGAELWRSDGTVAGTTLVLDIYPGTGTSTPSGMIVVGSTMYFSAFDATATIGTGRELWKTDGTPAGTMLVADIFVGTSSGILSTAASSYAPFGTGLLFAASSGTTAPGTGEELYFTDGTPAGTVLVADIFPGTSSGAPRFLTPFAGKVYFTATNGTTAPANGVELWVTDGTLAGTTLVIDIFVGVSGSIPSQPIVSNGKMFFSANAGTTTGLTGRELYVSDGTTAGTVLVVDNFPGTGNGIASQTLNIMVPFGTGVLVGMSNGTVAPATGEELWFSDGTAAGTVQVADINVGTVSSSPRVARVVGSKVFFAATTATTGYELFVTDGTGAGTTITRDIGTGTAAGVSSAVVSAGTASGSLLFGASDGTTAPGTGTELWISDGTLAGTVQVKDINTPQPQSSNPLNVVAFGNKTVFAATNGTAGIEPWITDGTPAGTIQLADIFVGASSSSPANFTVMGNLCFFTANSGTTAPATGLELYVTDGTPAGTVLVLDINVGTVSSTPTNLVVSNGKLFFNAITAAAGRELWTSDGTAAGTTLVVDFNPGTANGGQSFGQAMIPFGNGVMFSGITALTGAEICISDGTALGTVAIDFIPGAVGCDPSPFIPYNGFVYCNATDGVNGFELVRTDGTLAGTTLVKDIVPGAAEGNPGPFAVLGNRLFFFATDPTNGTELWISDGTSAGTNLLIDIAPGVASSVTNSPFAANLVVAGDRLFFPANDGTNGVELWTSDGTAAGTTLVRDINVGAGNGMLNVAAIAYPTGVGRKVLFAADNGVSGSEPYVSNGTSVGTTQIADLNAGPIGSTPGVFVTNSAASSILFPATDSVVGRELFAMTAASVGASLLDPYGVGCAGTGGRIPQISAGSPTSGNLGYAVHLSNGFGPGSGALLFGVNGANLPYSGCTILVDPASTLIALPTTIDASGNASVGLPIRVNAAWVGFSMYLQFFVVDPAGPFLGGGSTLSGGLRAQIGD
jgi:ELWxxDGT repeat protein